MTVSKVAPISVVFPARSIKWGMTKTLAEAVVISAQSKKAGISRIDSSQIWGDQAMYMKLRRQSGVPRRFLGAVGPLGRGTKKVFGMY